jgi:predicted dehydrogenase
MKIGVLGTGMVGGHRIKARRPRPRSDDGFSRGQHNRRAASWAKQVGTRTSVGSFADTARFGELLFNCTNGANSVAALRAADKKNLARKALIKHPSARGSRAEGAR